MILRNKFQAPVLGIRNGPAANQIKPHPLSKRQLGSACDGAVLIVFRFGESYAS